MDPAKAALLFGDEVVAEVPDDPVALGALVASGFREQDEDLGPDVRHLHWGRLAMHILDEDPPALWPTAQRLAAQGLDRRRVLLNLSLALAPLVIAEILEEDRPSPDRVAADLERLPVPPAARVLEAMLEIVRSDQLIGLDELVATLLAELGRDHDDQVAERMVDGLFDRAMDEDGPLALLAGDAVVHPASLASGLVFTHRLTPVERETGVVVLGADLAAHLRLALPITTGTGESVEPDLVGNEPAWLGPRGWLDDYEPGVLLGVRSESSGDLGEGTKVDVEQVAEEPDSSAELNEAVRRAYETEAADTELPIVAEDVVLRLVADHRDWFSAPRPPFGELLDAAGLERRGHWVAKGAAQWRNQAHFASLVELRDELGDPDDFSAAADVVGFIMGSEVDRADLRRSLARIADPEVLSVVAESVVGLDDDDEDVREAAERLVPLAGTHIQRAVALWLLAVTEERCFHAEAAESALRRAVHEDGRFEPALDRLAWYHADRGQLAEALALWHRLGFDAEDSPDVALLEELKDLGGGAGQRGSGKPGRNEPCWCGSGRKYKLCHAGLAGAVSLPLPDRVGWIWRKAMAFLERRGSGVAPSFVHLAFCFAGGTQDEAAVGEALHDPLVWDAGLVEGGWFETFLEERGPLLPDDERLLASSWTLVERTLYEVVEVQPGEGLTLRDLRSAEVLAVRERTSSRDVLPGTVLMGRAVHDGQTHQFVGSVMTVPAGREAEFLDVLDECDPEALCALVGSFHRPPTFTTREGETMVECRATLRADDPDALRSALNAAYEPAGDGLWAEHHTLENGDSVLRASLALTPAGLDVETASEPRLDRVLMTLRAALPGIEVIEEVRRPLAPGEPPPAPSRLLAASSQTEFGDLDPADLKTAMSEIAQTISTRWCDESVPALGGLTPRQAVNDPTRRETLGRLLAEFERRNGEVPEGIIELDTGLIRQILGIPV